MESLPHHLQNKFFLSLKRARTGAAICSGRVIVTATTVQQLTVLFKVEFGGVICKWNALKNVVMQNRIIIQEHKSKLLNIKEKMHKERNKM